MHGHRCVGERHHARASLAVAKPELGYLQVTRPPSVKVLGHLVQPLQPVSMSNRMAVTDDRFSGLALPRSSFWNTWQEAMAYSASAQEPLRCFSLYFWTWRHGLLPLTLSQAP